MANNKITQRVLLKISKYKNWTSVLVYPTKYYTQNTTPEEYNNSNVGVTN